MNIKEMVPKDKFDNVHIDDLNRLSDKEIKSIIYDLLKWIQDYNWPVAHEILPILIDRENLVFPYIHQILNGDDVMWKYWIMDLLIPEFTIEHKQELKKDILKFVNNIDNDEDSQTLREVAIACYNKCFKN